MQNRLEAVVEAVKKREEEEKNEHVRSTTVSQHASAAVCVRYGISCVGPFVLL